ncbi:IreB family regulatory phosphoprotein [Natronincola ferrireducens]|uniref:UPF0297 protein SAMN05660472_01520 n=1 Tax=Natronincola ferrireducens TaxID=393762 RepID=A0A1G9CPA7_9FIRM|nr:IreB family regulatory phosphoprotein [Natronincola ferrireducens]SDK53478.1 Uncharacterized protein, UPF0297 family [Natronincola ferrireducens]
MGDKFNLTMKFNLEKDKEKQVKDIIIEVHKSLEEKGYNPINQMIGYILSGDPTYITNYNEARSIIRKIERDELLEELLKTYLEKNRSE